MSAPLKKNDELTLEITGTASDGSGISRHEGFAVFVPFALPGETVRVHIIKTAKNYAVGKILEVLTPSASRVDPPCPYFGKCGGCSLMHISYADQLELKRRTVTDALERIGGFRGIEVKPVIGMDEPFRYRNKGSFPFGIVDGRVVWGLYSEKSHRLIPVSDCLIENSDAVRAANSVSDWAEANSVSIYDETTGKGILRHVVSRSLTGGVSVCVVTSGKLPAPDDLLARIRAAVPDLKSVVHNVNSGKTNVICGKEYRLIFGNETVTETICGSDFSVSAASFLQVNHVQTEKLYSLAVDGLGLKGGENTADIFCGIGTISLLMAKKAGSVAGIEYVPQAIEDAKKNAVRNGIANAEFFCGAAEEILPRLVSDGRSFDCVTLDPPRKGADPKVLSAIAESGARRIAYVSCDPATLARDLKILCGFGFRIESVQPVDVFPNTKHVETICCLYRQKKDFISAPYEPKNAD